MNNPIRSIRLSTYKHDGSSRLLIFRDDSVRDYNIEGVRRTRRVSRLVFELSLNLETRPSFSDGLQSTSWQVREWKK